MIQKNNKNLDLTIILKGCPKGTEFYHVVYGKVTFLGMDDSEYPIDFKVFGNDYDYTSVTKDGRMWGDHYGECVIFPSKDQRDWSKFERFWDKPKVEKFDINTLKPKEIKEIKSIEITLEKDNIFKMNFNGYEDEAGYNLIISKDNALSVARTLTRMANMFWEKLDKIAIEEIEKEK